MSTNYIDYGGVFDLMQVNITHSCLNLPFLSYLLLCFLLRYEGCVCFMTCSMLWHLFYAQQFQDKYISFVLKQIYILKFILGENMKFKGWSHTFTFFFNLHSIHNTRASDGLCDIQYITWTRISHTVHIQHIWEQILLWNN